MIVCANRNRTYYILNTRHGKIKHQRKRSIKRKKIPLIKSSLFQLGHKLAITTRNLEHDIEGYFLNLGKIKLTAVSRSMVIPSS
jgi:hypothetical protein